MNAKEYHADPAKTPSLSSSIAWEIEPSNTRAGSPKHGWLIHPKLGNQPKESTADMRFGTLCHSMLLGKGAKYSVAPVFKTKSGSVSESWATTEAKDWKYDCECRGLLPITRTEEKEAQNCVVEWAKQLKEFGLDYLLKGQQYEKYLSWKEKSGLRDLSCGVTKDFGGIEIEFRAMIDILTEDWREIWDVKTMPKAHPRKCLNKILDEGLPLRSEFYIRGVERTKPELAGKVKHGFLFCSVDAPYLVTPFRELDGRFRLIGKKQVERSIQTWGECLRTGKWGGYVSEPIQQAECPVWAFKDEIEEE